MRVLEQARLADVPALSDLLSLLFGQELEFSPNPEAQCAGVARIIGHPELGAILVCREGEVVIGMVTLLFTVSTALGERVALLEDMVMSPTHRGGGIGSTLLEFAVSFARDAGCKRITLLTDVDNEAAQRFYAKQGFARSSMLPLRLSLA